METRHRLPLVLAALTVLAACAHRPAEQVVHYACDSGQRITVHYRGADTAVVEIPPRAYVMQTAASPLGHRYVGRQLQWVAETEVGGNRGTLFTRGYDGGPGDIAERCHETGRE
jgi:membrane-bound inhibitor of C-type lysozyme